MVEDGERASAEKFCVVRKPLYGQLVARVNEQWRPGLASESRWDYHARQVRCRKNEVVLVYWYSMFREADLRDRGTGNPISCVANANST